MEFERKIVLIIKSKIRRFAGELYENRLINELVLKNIDILHKKISPELCCRYILQSFYISRNVKYEHSRHRAFCEVLSKFSGFDLLLSEMKGHRKEQGSDSTDDDCVLCKSDLTTIYKNLCKHSYRWEAIARLLLRETALVKRIKSNQQLRDDDSRLYELLDMWLQQDNVRLSELFEVLSSESVYLTKEAISLKELILAAHSHLPVYSSRSESVSPVIITSVTEIEETDSEIAILLEARHVGPNKRYSWFRNGVEIECGVGSIICVRITDIEQEGAYSCGEKNRIFSSINITVKTPIDKYTKHLSENYATKKEVKADTWPQVKQSTYINLATVTEKNIEVTHDISRHSIRGDLDDIYLGKTDTDYKSSFTSMKPGHRILIAGRPGSGKSTFVNKIAKDWSKCDIHFQSVRLLFLVHLRSFQSNPDVQLKDVVGQYFKDELDLATICSYCVKSKGLGYCFILDGLDEYQPRRKDVFIYQLIQKQCLEKAIVLTASRPAAIAEYREEADKQIEVLGFFNKQISKYINSYKFSTADRCSSLKRYLDNHPNIHHMCYLPIQSAMICFLFDLNENLPDTETQIYMEFAKHAILRSLYRYEDKKHTYLESVHSLTGDDRKVFLDICSIAFEKTQASLQILLQSDMDKFNKDIKIGDSLGLITIDTKATSLGYLNMYTFCHLTFQEFLAAYHIYCQNDEVRHKILMEYASKEHMQIVFKFFGGLVKFDSDFLFKVLIENSNFKHLFRIQCALKAQQNRICDNVCSSVLQFTNSFMTSSDFTALGYVISNAKKNPCMHITLDCSPTKENLDAFTKAVEGNLSVISLEFRGSVNGNFQILNNLVNALPSLQVLGIADTIQDHSDIESLLFPCLLHQFLRINRCPLNVTTLSQP